MCGIFAVFSRTGQPIAPKRYHKSAQTLREVGYQQSGKQRHRGPDDTGMRVIEDDGVVLVSERLAVVGLADGRQPFQSQDGTVHLVANGEIYNYLELAEGIAKKRGQYTPRSDCNVIIELYEEYGEEMFGRLSGMYAFALYDSKSKTVLLARDPFGVIPMYCGEDAEGNVWVASEMKCLVDVCVKIESFPPGVFRIGQVGGMVQKRFFQEAWMSDVPTEAVDLTVLRQGLESAVRSHLQCDVQFGALLSGGVDSSLIASIATKILRENDPKYRLRTFSVGLAGSPDLKYSRMVADYIDSDHTEYVFQIEEAIDCIRELVYHLDTYDVATMRCSIPMLLLTRHIKSLGRKMVLSGEGADEIFGGYLYFFKAPTPQDFHKESVTRLQQLYQSDCLRANKVAMAKGVELRVPFLDTTFVNYVMSIRPEDKMPGGQPRRIEKHILRSAFAHGYLPDAVLWRQKEQFSDGVGYSLIDTIREMTASGVSDEEFEKAAQTFPYNTPSTKEGYFYRSIFAELFPGEAAERTVEVWSPRTDWGCSADPSGRAQSDHVGN